MKRQNLVCALLYLQLFAAVPGGAESHQKVTVSMQSATVKPQDSQGILPTGIFRQVFISHGGSYAILNPQKRGNIPLEIAAITPLLQ
jgi:hypothetical protein